MPDPIQLTPQHLQAVQRKRRIALNFDVSFATRIWIRRNPGGTVDDLVEHLFDFTDQEGVINDSIWWNWTEGNQVPYPSKHLPLFEESTFRSWIEAGIDIVRLVDEATRRRGVESFYSHRMNGSDNDLGPFAEIPMKVEHPDWMFRTPWCVHEHNGYWNFALPQVHDYVIRNLLEVAEMYGFDGIDLDFARGVVFPSGEGWINREALTAFVHRLREALLEVAACRGRPFLLSARIPETLAGCHFDGIDIESWVASGLVDILALGVRSFEVDLGAFRDLVDGTHVMLLPSLDDHHASDGYQNPGIEVLRGVAANWWHQGADGIQTFNWNYGAGYPYTDQDWPGHLQAYREIGDPALLDGRDKTFVVERRGGGHGPTVIPNPEDWSTPRHAYANTNMKAQLPVALSNDERADTMLRLLVADAVDGGDAEATIRILLSDTGADDIAAADRLDAVIVATIGHGKPGLMNQPAAKAVAGAVRLRINNVPLPPPTVDGGWLVTTVARGALAVGENLLGISVTERQPGAPALLVEKLELSISYPG